MSTTITWFNQYDNSSWNQKGIWIADFIRINCCKLVRYIISISMKTNHITNLHALQSIIPIISTVWNSVQPKFLKTAKN